MTIKYDEKKVEILYREAADMIDTLSKAQQLAVEPYIDKSGSFLDLAGGTGAYSMALKQRMPDSEFLCIDLDENALMAGQKYSDEKEIPIRFEAGTANCIPLADETVDYVVIRKALQYFSPLEDSIREIYRVLKPGGKFFIIKHINYPAYPFYYLLKEGNTDFIRKKGYYANLTSWVSSLKIIKILKKYNFSESTIVPTDFISKDISNLKPVFLKKLLAPFAVKPFIVSIK